MEVIPFFRMRPPPTNATAEDMTQNDSGTTGVSIELPINAIYKGWCKKTPLLKITTYLESKIVRSIPLRNVNVTDLKSIRLQFFKSEVLSISKLKLPLYF